MYKMFYGSAPVFFVRDLATSLDYYCDVLGFGRPYLWGDPPSFAMPRREDMILMLSQTGEIEHIRPKKVIWDAYFWVRDARELFEEFTGKGAKIIRTLEYQEHYGNLEFLIEDPDGYTLAFGQELNEPSFYGSKPAVAPEETEFLSLSPVLASANVARDIRWYEEKLGFKNVFDSTHHSAEPVNYAVLGRQGLYLHLQFQFPKDMTQTDVRIQVKNIRPIFETYVASGALAESAMRLQTAWGTNEFGLFDLNRNRLTFFEDL